METYLTHGTCSTEVSRVAIIFTGAEITQSKERHLLFDSCFWRQGERSTGRGAEDHKVSKSTRIYALGTESETRPRDCSCTLRAVCSSPVHRRGSKSGFPRIPGCRDPAFPTSRVFSLPEMCLNSSPLSLQRFFSTCGIVGSRWLHLNSGLTVKTPECFGN